VAALVIVVAGLKFAQGVVVPILLAAFLAFVCLPFTNALIRRGVSRTPSILIVVFAAILCVVSLCLVVGNSVTEFTNDLTSYQSRIDDLRERGRSWLEGHGVRVGKREFAEVFNAGALLRLVASTASGVIASASNVFVVLLIVIFVLFEAHHLPEKLRRARGDPKASLEQYDQIRDSVYQYLQVKTLVSLATGILVALLNFAAGVDFPILWGLVAFLFNFVPSIGSIIAAVPAVLLALVLHGPGTAALVGGGYLAINTVIGNIIEPRIMGGTLGLSPLVVLLSLFFWSWVLGPVGMLLSIPLTMIVKIVCEHDPSLAGVSVLLGPAQPESCVREEEMENRG